MAKSKVDTKALEQSNGDSFFPTDMSGDKAEAVRILRDAVDTILALASTTDRQAEQFAEQLCGATDFLLNGRGKYQGKRAWVAAKCAEVVEAEQAVQDNVAGSGRRLERCEAYRDIAENEERDLDMIDRAFREAYFGITETHYAPYQPKESKQPQARSLADRIAARKAKVA